MTLFTDAASALRVADSAELLWPPFLAALPVSGVGISTLGDPFGTEVLSASDVPAAVLEELQLDLGEGPAWAAIRGGRPVLEADLARTTAPAWPAALHAMLATGVHGVFAFPMRVGFVDVGAVDLYTRDHVELTAELVDDACSLAAIAARRILRRAVIASEDDGGPAAPQPGRYSRREVHQASGMVAAQLSIDVDDALLVLRGHAFATERPLRDVAVEVVERKLDFSRQAPGIEE